jgi:dihydroflavonol-4-reductase
MITVVTGASGFLGGVLVRDLLARGHRVRAADIRRGPSLEGLGVEFVTVDVLNSASLQPALDGADVVYHLAAMISVTGDPTGRVRSVNVDGVRNVAETALAVGVGRLVHCSSVHAYDLETTEPLIDETSARATRPGLPAYDRSKAAGEAALQEVVKRGLDAVVVNPTGVIGPYDFAPSRMGHVFLALAQSRLPALVNGGFDWVDVRDVASALMTAEQRGRSGESYLLPGHHVSLPDLSSVAQDVTGVPGPTITLPIGLARLATPLTNVIGRRTASPLWFTTESLHALRFSPPVSGGKAAAALDHHPRPFDETVHDIYRWFTDEGMLSGV